MICPLCKSKNFDLIWYDKIRDGKNLWSKKKFKISKCRNCGLVFLNKRSKKLIDNKVFRKRFDGSNSILKYKNFNKPREERKLNIIKKYVNFKNKIILESNCGAATNLDLLKKTGKMTAGLDSHIYKSHVKKKHLFFSSLKELKKSKINYDIILSLSELEHQFDLFKFLGILKSKLKTKGIIVFRIPNYNNIYRLMLNEKFLKYDFRLSHNYYFTKKSCDYLFQKTNFKIIKSIGLQEYSVNHLIQYIKSGKRVNTYKNVINNEISKEINFNLEQNFLSTSFLYIVGNAK